MFVQDEKKQVEMREDEGMGHPDLKYGDTMVFLQHAESGLWLSYVTFETKKRGIGRVEEKKVGSQTLVLGIRINLLSFILLHLSLLCCCT